MSPRILFLFSILLVGGCQSVQDDLSPSNADRRPTVTADSVGYQAGQRAADFTLSDSLGNSVRLSDQLAGGGDPADAVVLYFTMWCPICLGHSDHLIYSMLPRFAGRGTVHWYLVDYVSGNVVASRAQEQANGYAGSGLTTLVDANQTAYNSMHAAMGTVVVIGPDGIIRLNEDYRDGQALAAVLDTLLPP